ncbi:hypothetical protein MesoLj131c_62290 [Mesorhizobium sp. 131-3-5]|uniref:hypothetical protein n=1 Tax=Mesorhizobium sp. 131-3-5 TaxID=2744520 RepID=UPI001927A3E1|nr:hypothetical protein [Mesorhizobium sp. 131-3-5]BCH11971.1 hypothetical protein MesoLj131c_62290 [Mesorhizobium sp. 131-3-5]
MKDMTPGVLAVLLFFVVGAFATNPILGVVVCVVCVIWANIDYRREQREKRDQDDRDR